MGQVLLVEDEPLIAMMLSDWIEELGHTVVGPATTVEQAMSLGSTSVDAAIVDHNLQGRSCTPVIQLLTERQIAFALSSGASQAELGQQFPGIPLMAKPYVFEDVQRTVGALMKGKG